LIGTVIQGTLGTVNYCVACKVLDSMPALLGLSMSQDTYVVNWNNQLLPRWRKLC